MSERSDAEWFAAAKHYENAVKEIDKWKSLAGELEERVSHEDLCILSHWSQGEPTPDGGYRTMYKGKWYQTKPIDETPKCDCGLEEVLTKARAAGL